MASTGPIQQDSDIEAAHFIQNADANATPANNEGYVPALEENGKLHVQFVPNAIGGDGSDGALTIASGVTDIDLGGEQYVVKNYTSVSITGTGSVTFSNPHAKGTVIVFKNSGNTTITSTATRAIDFRGVGAARGEQPTGLVFDATLPSNFNAGLQYPNPNYYTSSVNQFYAERSLRVSCGISGENGGNGPTETAGSGGRGGGVLIIETAGTYECSSTIDGSGFDGGDGEDATGGNEAPGGGGGGSAGMFISLYNSLVSDTGTYTLAGGNGGDSGAPNGPSGNGGEGGGGAGSRVADGGDGGENNNEDGDDAAGLGAGGGGGCGKSSAAAGARTGGTGGATLAPIIGTYY